MCSSSSSSRPLVNGHIFLSVASTCIESCCTDAPHLKAFVLFVCALQASALKVTTLTVVALSVAQFDATASEVVPVELLN